MNIRKLVESKLFREDEEKDFINKYRNKKFNELPSNLQDYIIGSGFSASEWDNLDPNDTDQVIPTVLGDAWTDGIKESVKLFSESDASELKSLISSSKYDNNFTGVREFMSTVDINSARKLSDNETSELKDKIKNGQFDDNEHTYVLFRHNPEEKERYSYYLVGIIRDNKFKEISYRHRRGVRDDHYLGYPRDLSEVPDYVNSVYCLDNKYPDIDTSDLDDSIFDQDKLNKLKDLCSLKYQNIGKGWISYDKENGEWSYAYSNYTFPRRNKSLLKACLSIDGDNDRKIRDYDKKRAISLINKMLNWF